MVKSYKNKHVKGISAEKSYDYSTHYLLLSADRTVLCQVTCDQIEGSMNWEEEKPKNKERIFTLYPSQLEKFHKWRKEKDSEVYVGAVGGAYEFIFIPTGIGTISKVRCADGTEIDLTEDDDIG